MSLFTYKQRNNINLVIIVALGGLIAYSLLGIFSSILGTLVLYTILRPVYLYMVQDHHLNKRFSAILLFTSIVLIVLPFYGLSNMVITKIHELQSDQIYYTNLFFKIKHLIPVGGDAERLIGEGLRKAGTWATELFPSLISGAFNIVLGLLLMYFLLYFMLVEHERFEAAMLKYAPFREQNALRFAEEHHLCQRCRARSDLFGAGLIGQSFFLCAGLQRSLFLGRHHHVYLFCSCPWSTDHLCACCNYANRQWQ
jgi:predicted PurR-regulated permease PerM